MFNKTQISQMRHVCVPIFLNLQEQFEFPEVSLFNHAGSEIKIFKTSLFQRTILFLCFVNKKKVSGKYFHR
jgi:hypothetical protein